MKRLTGIESRKLAGGCVTARDKSVLPFGTLSSLRNMRNTHPGFKQRPGQRRVHPTPDGENQVVTLFQFSKSKTEEMHLFAQMDDGDVLRALARPPAVAPGVFGTEVFSGAAAGQVPASWGVLDDLLLYSNGVDPHQIYPGTSSAIRQFVAFRGTGPIPDIPQGGQDYSEQVSDGQAETVAVLDALGAFSDHHCIFFRTPVPCASISLTIASANINAAAASIYYWRSDSTWAAVADLADATASPGGASLHQSGAISWSPPSDLQEKFAFGVCGFWYQIRFSAALSATVRVSQVTCAAGWQPTRNVWDGTSQYAIEAHLEGASQFLTYAAGAVDLSDCAAGKKCYLAFTDPVEGIYADPGATPTAAGNSIASLKYWDGSAWVTVGAVTDGSAGLSQAGWITFARKPAQPLQFHACLYHAYWYELTFAQQIQLDTVVAFQGMPYFDVSELGLGHAVCVWKDRACYVFDRYGAYLYISAKNAPFVLNGADYGILKGGDGRANKIVAMRRFYNELMVWQEEKGVEGGCITIFEGYSPATFGKVVLSSKIGSMNAKSVAVVDGVLTATKTDEVIKTLAFCLSRFGVAVTDGRTVSLVSDDIANYFDPAKPECIRYGYEQQMWLEHDPGGNVIRLGLVCGPTATTPNVFPVFDLVTKTWSFDTPAQPLSCMVNIEAGGANPLLQLGGGVADGTVYQLNYGVNDVDRPVAAGFELILGHKGLVLDLAEVMVRLAAQLNGSALLTVKENEKQKIIKHLSMIPEKTMHRTRRHRFRCLATSDLLTLDIANSSIDESLEVFDLGVETWIWEAR